MPALYMIQGGTDAAGQAANKIEDASAGMTRATDTAGNGWAWNPRAAQWQRLLVMKGDGSTILSALAVKFYGSAGAWKQIAQLPENTGIVGLDGTKAIPGDVILIPNLQQPWTPPTSTGGGTDVGPTGGDAPPIIDPGKVAGAIPGLGEPPPGWPSGLPWPGTQPGGGGDTPGGSTPAGDSPPGGSTGGEQPVEVVPTGSTVTTSLATTSGEPKFWTTPKIVAAGVVGVGVLGTVIYLVTRKPTRRRRR